MFESVLGWLKHAGIMVFVQSLRLFLKTFAFVSQRDRERGVALVLGFVILL